MDPLPMLPASCSLDADGLRMQIDRYRAVGRGSTGLERDPRRLVIRAGDQVPETLIETLLAVETECCPFFDLDWEPAPRRLSIAVTSSEHEPALQALATAIGLSARA
jgi:hypothetical protein